MKKREIPYHTDLNKPTFLSLIKLDTLISPRFAILFVMHS